MNLSILPRNIQRRENLNPTFPRKKQTKRHTETSVVIIEELKETINTQEYRFSDKLSFNRIRRDFRTV